MKRVGSSQVLARANSPIYRYHVEVSKFGCWLNLISSTISFVIFFLETHECSCALVPMFPIFHPRFGNDLEFVLYALFKRVIIAKI